MMDLCFIAFEPQPQAAELPERFTFPFHYEPHSLALRASTELQNLLLSGAIAYGFGLNNEPKSESVGKMFGVLVVERADGCIGYLKAFSGKVGVSAVLEGFVPPVFNLHSPDGVFKREEQNISALNHQIEELEKSAEYRALNITHLDLKKEAEKEQNEFKERYRIGKQHRAEQRRLLAEKENVEGTLDQLNRESKKQQSEYKQVVRKWQGILTEHEQLLQDHYHKIEALKLNRKERSAALQDWLFHQYHFLSAQGNSKDLLSVFYPLEPPAGAGECAAPKLLQYAFANNYKPLCMAEFWWGKPPINELRVHKANYPACRGKCKPILDFMLEGMTLDDNPLASSDVKKSLDVIYEDDALLVLNKPPGLLSVPGKLGQDSVQLRIKEILTHATGPLIVHRLDEATSGIMLIAKTEQAYRAVQQQFINRHIKKRYVALIDGVLSKDKGTIRLPLRPDIYERPRQLVCFDHGKDALTVWEKVATEGNAFTRVYFYPHSGRTHQLRVHAAHSLGLGMAIRGDELYGKRDERLFLHAAEIQLVHPVSGKKMHFTSEPEF
jgi:tRNA pseudouridine32 synthase/23S rRNA pseudouridine746 synthase